MAENVFTASLEPQILAHFCSARFEKPDQAAVMVEMPVAEDQRIDPRRVDLHDLEVVGVDLWGKAKVEQIAPLLAAARCFDVQCQAPLALERLALRGGGKAGALDAETWAFQRLQKDVVLVVGDLANYDAVDHRRIKVFRRRSSGPAPAAIRSPPRSAKIVCD